MNGTLYKRKDARRSALEEIVRKMGLENFTKQKIKSLRATYQHESHKIEKSLGSGAGLEDVYKQSMKWFTLMTEAMKSGVLKTGPVSTSAICTSSNLYTFFLTILVHLFLSILLLTHLKQRPPLKAKLVNVCERYLLRYLLSFTCSKLLVHLPCLPTGHV
jgi:hypothetical protein